MWHRLPACVLRATGWKPMPPLQPEPSLTTVDRICQDTLTRGNCHAGNLLEENIRKRWFELSQDKFSIRFIDRDYADKFNLPT